jgi:dihydroorotate dehydrogenase electron transfer subunit
MGRGTEALSELVRGSEVEALVPLGNGWLDEHRRIALASEPGETEHADRNKPQRAIVVAGGIGSASVFLLCEELIRSNTPTQIFFGAATESVAAGCGLEDFQRLRLPLTVTTDDGSLGERGFVTAPLERHLSEAGSADSVIYACGPWVMMRRVAEIAEQFGARCFASLEAPMGCGFGVCVGCVVAVKTAGPAGYGSYKRVCIDGSIFPAEMIRWEINAMAH